MPTFDKECCVRSFPPIAVALASLLSISVIAAADDSRNAIGAGGRIGCDDNPRRVTRLRITKPGIYENFLVDGNFHGSTLVGIKASHVTLRNSEIRNGTHNAIAVYANDVVIENCKIHHALKGAFKDNQDAHGITGRTNNLTIRNCEISYVSGDSVQFDPDRGPWDNVVIENCTFATAALPNDAAGFKRGERPGENAVDTKQLRRNRRSRMTIRNSLFYGWRGGPITNQAALNLKEHVDVTIENCILADNEIAFRLRGDTGERGGAAVTIRDCAVYDSAVAARMEDRINNLKIHRLGIGDGVQRTFQIAGGRGSGFENVGQFRARPIKQALRQGLNSDRQP